MQIIYDTFCIFVIIQYICRKHTGIMADRKIIHLHFNSDGSDHYFGSIAAIYSMFPKEEIGVSYGSLRNFGLSPDKPYGNDKITVKEGVLITAKGERGQNLKRNTSKEK